MRPRLTIVLIFFIIVASCTTVSRSLSAETGSFVSVGENSLAFWKHVMTPDIQAKYKANSITTFCNIFVADTLRDHLGMDVFKKVMPDGTQSPQAAYAEWQKNPNLFRLDPKKYTTVHIQNLADEGYIILGVYHSKKYKSHLMFAGNSNLRFSTVPPVKQLEGKSIADVTEDWLPVVVQAGTYTGVTSAAYGSNGWLTPPGGLFESGVVMFYLIRS